jgi:hypothetical protein
MTMMAKFATVLVGAGIGSLVGLASGNAALVGGALIVLGAVAFVATSLTRRRPASVPGVSSDEGWRAFEREIARARRYEHPLTLVRVELPEDAGSWYERLSPHFREVDVAWRDPSAIWLAVPGADEAAAAPIVARLLREAPELADVAVVRNASFPADALTAGALVGQLLSDGDRPIRLPVRADEVIAGDVTDRQLGGVSG